jgi:hypothetical protein
VPGADDPPRASAALIGQRPRPDRTGRPGQHGPNAFTIWYGRDGIIVGVLTHHADEDYERGRSLVEQRAAFR